MGFKMSEEFDLPLRCEYNGTWDATVDNFIDKNRKVVKPFEWRHSNFAEAFVLAVNSHDTLSQELAELKGQLAEAEKLVHEAATYITCYGRMDDDSWHARYARYNKLFPQKALADHAATRGDEDMKTGPEKITFVIADTHSPFCLAHETGIASQPSKRTVTIELTVEQRKTLRLNSVGTNGATEIFEQIIDCFPEARND